MRHLLRSLTEQQDDLALLDSGPSVNFITKKALDICKMTLNPFEATLELADGNSSPTLGTEPGGHHLQ
ncbi:TPA: hypothetical protein ACH3X2_005058 [Trebouxia sp. C0005]